MSQHAENERHSSVVAPSEIPSLVSFLERETSLHFWSFPPLPSHSPSISHSAPLRSVCEDVRSPVARAKTITKRPVETFIRVDPAPLCKGGRVPPPPGGREYLGERDTPFLRDLGNFIKRPLAPTLFPLFMEIPFLMRPARSETLPDLALRKPLDPLPCPPAASPSRTGRVMMTSK